jgi:hypothetical protein
LKKAYNLKSTSAEILMGKKKIDAREIRSLPRQRSQNLLRSALIEVEER